MKKRNEKSELEISDLHVVVEGVEIIKGVSFTVYQRKVHVLMGPNGAGKSTLAYALMGHPRYKITNGRILLDGNDITHEPAEIRAKAGLFLSFQYPVEIPGVKMSHFLRTAFNNQQSKNMSVPEFQQLLQEKLDLLKIDHSFARRYLNESFSGGEKKKAEILQLLLLQPKYAILDETDSGLDVDAMKIVAEGINMLQKDKKMAVLVITHYQRFLEILKPNEVSIMINGRIVKNGGEELVKEIEKRGFENIK